MGKRTTFLIVVSIPCVLLFVTSCKRSTNGHSDRNATVSYEVLNTVEYSGSNEHFSQQANGTMVVEKQPLTSGDVAYLYSFVAEVIPDDGKTVGEISFPAVSLLRHPNTDRMVGGNAVLKNLGLVANAALDQIKGHLQLDGTPLKRTFEFNIAAEFPRTLSYKLTAKKQKINAKGTVVAVLAISESFEYGVPSKKMRITGRHKVLCVLDSAMEEVVYLCSNFVATAPEGNGVGNLNIESLMYQLEDNEPLSLEGLDL